MKKNNKAFTLADYVDQLVETQPDAVISSFHDEINVFTVSELNEKTNLLAKGLIYNGVDKGTPVALVVAETTNCLTFVLALAKIGALLVPLNDQMELALISETLKKESVQTIGFYADTFLSRFKQLIPDYLQSERGYLQSTDYPLLKNIVTFGSIKNRGIFTTRELMLLGAHMDDIEMESSLKVISPDDVFIKKVERNKEATGSTSLTHKDLLTDDFSLKKLQQLLLEMV
ncbi:AMP-binding protein [Roseimarinus sediminis]|uniref:AMP-binding protein n=1 Tax=Roseimarinus sediminis TaxID=1610899 RepID=UPI003D24C0D6